MEGAEFAEKLILPLIIRAASKNRVPRKSVFGIGNTILRFGLKTAPKISPSDCFLGTTLSLENSINSINSIHKHDIKKAAP